MNKISSSDRSYIPLLIPTWYTIFYINYIKLCSNLILRNLYKEIVYQVGINKGIILRCTAYQISRSYTVYCTAPNTFHCVYNLMMAC